MYGRVVGGRYEIGDRLGGGGMAVVYKGRDLQLGRDVAVKVLRPQLGTDDDFIRRFRREAQNASSLSHPNIVQIYDVGEEGDTYYIVLELVEGRSLKEMIQQQGPLPINEACRIALEILSALAHAHEGRIVHRDIKPHNILISTDGKVKVTDFGIARATTTDTVTHTGSIMGSAHYFSPEQADGKVTGEKSDLYSLGVVLYEMVTGTVPFQGDSPITVAIKHLRDNPTPPSYLNAEVPLELDRMIMRALEKSPDDRFESAEAMRTALYEFLALHAAGETHMQSGDFPTMDLRSLRTQKFRREDEKFGAAPHQPRHEPRRVRATVDPKRRRSYAWIWVLAVALVVVGGIGAGAWAIMDFFAVPDVKVPNVVGLHLTKAEDTLKAANLRHKTGSEQYSEYPPLSVIRADPAPGTLVKQGREVELTISKGPEAVTLVDVKNRPEDQARLAIESQNLVVGDNVVRRTDSQVPEGRVIETTPPGGTSVQVRSTINMTVSKGPLRVPNVVGLTLQDAEAALRKEGLLVRRGPYRSDSVKPRDTVLNTEPTAGTAVEPNSSVTLTLAEGPTGQAKPFRIELRVPKANPNSTATTVEFQVILTDFIQGVPQDRATNVKPGKYPVGQVVVVEGSYYDEAAFLKVLADGVNVLNEPVVKKAP